MLEGAFGVVLASKISMHASAGSLHGLPSFRLFYIRTFTMAGGGGRFLRFSGRACMFRSQSGRLQATPFDVTPLREVADVGWSPNCQVELVILINVFLFPNCGLFLTLVRWVGPFL